MIATFIVIAVGVVVGAGYYGWRRYKDEYVGNSGD